MTSARTISPHRRKAMCRFLESAGIDPDLVPSEACLDVTRDGDTTRIRWREYYRDENGNLEYDPKLRNARLFPTREITVDEEPPFEWHDLREDET